MGVGILAVLLAAALPFRAEPVDPVEALTAQNVTVIAHAGGAGHAPANTIEAFDTAVEMGAHVLEMDLQLTADNEVVVIHDADVDRTTNGIGTVREMTLEELRELDAGYSWQDDSGEFPFRDEGVQIPTLNEVIERYEDYPMVVELKTDGGEDIVDAVAAVIDRHGVHDTVVVSSFDAQYLERFREIMPDVATNLGVNEAGRFYALQLFGLHRWHAPPGEVLQVPSTYSGIPVFVPGFVRKAEQMGLHVQVWTINEYDEILELLERGVHGIITDYPDRARAAATSVGRSLRNP
ncbi:MAG: glycerophosphodiester phosphodiesterase [Spirochaetia bacterium]